MAAGRPAVGREVGAIPELLEQDVTGLIEPPGDSTGLARAISQLLNGLAKRDLMGIAAWRRVEQRFCMQVWVKGRVRILDEVAVGGN